MIALGFLGACGGNVAVSSGGNGGEGGTGAESGGTTTTTGTTTGNTGGNTGGTGGNTGGTGGGTGGNTGGTGGEGGGCAPYGLLDCVAAFPTCVPVYDDKCCPNCSPGGCADCINYQFHHCASWQAACAGDPPQDCGYAPEWACNGQEPSCETIGGGVEPCSAQPGCVPAYCNEAADCPVAYQCHPVKSNMCNAICASAPPPCPPGTVAETDGFCLTGWCIEQKLCPSAL